MHGRAALIGIDWGTTSFRAYRIDADGRVLETRSAPAGILKVADGDFEAVLEREVGPWLAAAPALPVVISGMITSRQGWLEVPYCACPAGSAELAERAPGARHQGRPPAAFRPRPVADRRRWRARRDPRRGDPDHRRARSRAMTARGRQAIVLPGTHSKWAFAEDGRIVWFATFMTGEVFAVLKEHSILGRLMAGRRAGRGRLRARPELCARRAGAACSSGCSARARSACSTSCRRTRSRPISRAC